jgi:hypothetical protein
MTETPQQPTPLHSGGLTVVARLIKGHRASQTVDFSEDG